MPKAGEVQLKTTVREAKAAAAWLQDYLIATSQGTVLGGPQGLTSRTSKLVELVNLLFIKSAKRDVNKGFEIVLKRELLAEFQILHSHMQAIHRQHLIWIVAPLDNFAQSANAALAGRGRRGRSEQEKLVEAQRLRECIVRNDQSISNDKLDSRTVDFLIERNNAMQRNIRRLESAKRKPEFFRPKATVLTGSAVLRKST